MRVPTRPSRAIFGLLAILGIALAILGLYSGLPSTENETVYQRAANAPEATNTSVAMYMPLLARAVTPRPTLTPTATPIPPPTLTPTATSPADAQPLLWSQNVNGHWQIYKRTSGGQPVLVSQNPNVDDIDPSLSWDGTAIAFASNRDYATCPTRYEIYRMDTNGGSVERMTNTTGACLGATGDVALTTNMNPAWSPKIGEEQWIAFTSNAGTYGTFDIYRIPVNGPFPIDVSGNNQYTYRLTWPQAPDQPTSTPVGPTATPTPTSTPFVAPTATGAPTSSPYDNYFRLSSSRMPTYSPDGSQIAFTSNRRGDNPARGGRDQIWVMTANGYNLTQVTYALGQNSWPKWSPSGNRIAYASNRTGNWEVFSINPDGTGDMQISLSRSGAVNAQPTWSGSGTRLAFINSSGGDVFVYTINPDGTNLSASPLVSGPLYAPAWSP